MQKNDQGFTNDEPDYWEVFLQAPVSRECTVYLATTGKVTDAAIDKLIEYLNVIKPGFADSAAPITDTQEAQ